MEENQLHFYHQENINNKFALIFSFFFQDKQFRGEIFRSSESSYFIRLYYCSVSMCFIRFFFASTKCFNNMCGCICVDIYGFYISLFQYNKIAFGRKVPDEKINTLLVSILEHINPNMDGLFGVRF